MNATQTNKVNYPEQWKLMVLICLPCLLITTVSLYLVDISPYLIAFILLILLLLSSYVIVASKQSSEHQIRTLSNIVEAMIYGDYSLRGRVQANQAFQELLEHINQLADTLSRHKIEAKESRLLLEKIMEQMDAMVIAVDEQGYIVIANFSAQKLILNRNVDGAGVEKTQQIKLSDNPLGSMILNAKAGILNFNQVQFDQAQSDQAQLSGEHFLIKESFLSEGKKHHLYLITNAERLLMEKERKAWQSLFRVLSHELNNSLTPIAAVSQSMKQKLKQTDSVINQTSLYKGISLINERSESLSSFIASYSQLSHLPQPNKTNFELKVFINNITKLYPHCHFTLSSNIENFEGFEIEADRSQLEQVLVNLFKNAIEAMDKLENKVIEIHCRQNDKWLQIFIKDQGTGIVNLNNLFVPFYSTKPQGSGIGLTLSRQILFNHDGMLKLYNYESGAEAMISLPLSNELLSKRLN